MEQARSINEELLREVLTPPQPHPAHPSAHHSASVVLSTWSTTYFVHSAPLLSRINPARANHTLVHIGPLLSHQP